MLDLAYDAIREGLDYDRVGLSLVDHECNGLIEQIGTDQLGRKFYPRSRLLSLAEGSYHGRILSEPCMQADGVGFRYRLNAAEEMPAELHEHLDGLPGQNLLVAMRTAETVLGLISVDNLVSGRSVKPEDAPPLVALANALATALDNVNLLEGHTRRISLLDTTLRQRMNQLEWLRETSRAITSARTLEEVLDVVYEGVRGGLGFDRVGIMLFDNERSVWVERRGTDEQGMKIVLATRSDSFAAGSESLTNPVMSALLRGAEFYYTTDAWADFPEEHRYLLDGHVHHNLVVPLRCGEQMTGSISVDNFPSGRPLTLDEAGPLLAVAHQVATAIENARLLEREQIERARLSLLLDSARAVASTLDRESILHALAAQLVSALDAAGAVFTDIDLTSWTACSPVRYASPRSHMPLTLDDRWNPLTSSLIVIDVARNRTPWQGRLDDPGLPAEERAYLQQRELIGELFVPVVVRDTVTSVLEVYWDREADITPDTVAICTAIAEQAAVALANAQLYAAEADQRRRAEIRARRLVQVQHVGERLKADLDPGEIAQRVVDAAREASGFRVVTLDLADEPEDADSLWRVVATIGVSQKRVAELAAATHSVADIPNMFSPEFRYSRSYLITEGPHHHDHEGPDAPTWPWVPDESRYGLTAWRAGDELLVPLTEREERRWIGYLSLGDPESSVRPEREDVELLEILADQAVVALRNAYLLRQARQTALDRARAEETVRASEARLRAVLQSSPILLFSLDNQGKFTLSTGGDLGLLGVRPEELAGKPISSTFAHRPEMLVHYSRAAAGESHTATIDFEGASVEMHWSPEHSHDGAVAGVIAVAVDVTDRVAAQRAAEALARLRSDFVASVSHELRTPLTAIVGYGELLQARWAHLDEGQRLEHIARIVNSANRQKRLVEDLLLLSRVDQGDLQPKQDLVQIAHAVARASDEVRSSYPGQRIDLAGASDLVAHGDLERVTQVLVNLIDNAAKYSPEGNPITVTWCAEGGDVAVRVRDQGSGIPTSGRDQLFTRFGRVPGSRTRAGRVGTGLGLHLGRQLVSAMRGKLELEDTGPAGSVFCLRLPAELNYT